MDDTKYVRRLKFILLVTVNLAVYGSIIFLIVGVLREFNKQQAPINEQLKQAYEIER